ncbi:DNA gyrase modulator [Clostridium sp. 'deep sea']|uniref:PmbA/TldA family metallopeptidase n=1 Tax=Clostridium sp. 'deep sea' TaxID=2779445 RepID=UPI001FAD1DF6|nr:DNA gyrase modulator [Clostridium sp. 'deep sea']
MFQYNLGAYLKNCKNYMELRVQDNSIQVVQLVNGNIALNSQESRRGVSARVFNNGSWGFASSSNINSNSILAVINDADFNSNFLNSKLNRSVKRFAATNPQVSNSFATKKSRLTAKQKDF